MIVSTLAQHISRHIQHFRTLPDRDQQAITRMAWQWAAGAPHEREPTCTPFTKGFLRDVWGSDERARAVLANRYFFVHAPGVKGEGIASAWRPRPGLEAAISDCLDEDRACDLLAENGKRLAKWPAALSSRRGQAHSSFAGLTCANAVPVDMQALSACADTGTSAEQRAARSLLRLANNTVNPGHVPISYEEVGTGRLFARMGILQGHSRRTRCAALNGRWDYDISNCHFTALVFLARGVGMRLPVTETYLANKQAMRNELATHCGSTTDGVKQALLAMVYGMRMTAWSDGALTHALGSQDAARCFASAGFVRNLRIELKTVADALIEKNTVLGGRVRNALGRAADFRDGRSSLSAHILQGLEAAALRAVIRQYGDSVLLAIHDGWVMDRWVSPEDLQAAILAETGCPFTIECQPLQVQVDTAAKNGIAFSEQQLTEGHSKIHASSGVTAPSWVDPFLPQVEPGVSWSGTRRSGLVISNLMSWCADPGVHGVHWTGGGHRRAAQATPPVEQSQTS